MHADSGSKTRVGALFRTLKLSVGKSATCLLALLVYAGSIYAAEKPDFPGVRRLMSEQEFKNAGLHKLSPAEINAFDQWLIEYTANDAGVVKNRSVAVKEAAQAEKIQAKVVGEFNGWTGDTVFHLDNGQIWKQRLRGRYDASEEQADVVIDKNWLGFYRLTVISSGRSVGVKRIK